MYVASPVAADAQVFPGERGSPRAREAADLWTRRWGGGSPPRIQPLGINTVQQQQQAQHFQAAPGGPQPPPWGSQAGAHGGGVYGFPQAHFPLASPSSLFDAGKGQQQGQWFLSQAQGQPMAMHPAYEKFAHTTFYVHPPATEGKPPHKRRLSESDDPMEADSPRRPRLQVS